MLSMCRWRPTTTGYNTCQKYKQVRQQDAYTSYGGSVKTLQHPTFFSNVPFRWWLYASWTIWKVRKLQSWRYSNKDIGTMHPRIGKVRGKDRGGKRVGRGRKRKCRNNSPKMQHIWHYMGRPWGYCPVPFRKFFFTSNISVADSYKALKLTILEKLATKCSTFGEYRWTGTIHCPVPNTLESCFY